MSNKLEVIPVIELAPSEYGEAEYDYPNGSSSELPNEWNNYWLKSLAYSGITDIQACIKGEFFADISKISKASLEIILKTQLEEIATIELDEICNLEGGLIILLDEKPIIKPQCCSSISDVEYWKEIISDEPNEWKQVWIGHPMVYVKIFNNDLQFSELTESNSPKDKVISVISFESFKGKLNVAFDQIKSFEKFVNNTLKGMNYNFPESIAGVLVKNKR